MMDAGTLQNLVVAAEKHEAAIERMSKANTETLAGKSLHERVQFDVEKELARRLLTRAEENYRRMVDEAAEQQFRRLVR